METSKEERKRGSRELVWVGSDVEGGEVGLSPTQ